MSEWTPFILSNFEWDVLKMYMKHGYGDEKLYHTSFFTTNLTDETVCMTLKEFAENAIDYDGSRWMDKESECVDNISELINSMMSKLESYCGPKCSGMCSECHFTSAVGIVNEFISALKLNKEDKENTAMEAKEIIETMRKEDRLLKESDVVKAVQKELINMGYEPFEEKVRGSIFCN